MLAVAIKTRKIEPKESLFTILDDYILTLQENTIIALASKIISTCENNILDQTKDKMSIIEQEADSCFALPKKAQGFCLTLKNKRLIPNAGLDESNCHNAYVLLPKEPQKSAKQIWQYLRNKHQVKNLGIIITDSNITPLRRGVTGISIGWCGFKPLYDYKGQVDIFERQLQVTQINLLDSLATVATLCMGEGGEQTPITILKDVPKVSFQNRAPNSKEESMVSIDMASDLFNCILLPVISL